MGQLPLLVQRGYFAVEFLVKGYDVLLFKLEGLGKGVLFKFRKACIIAENVDGIFSHVVHIAYFAHVSGHPIDVDLRYAA